MSNMQNIHVHTGFHNKYKPRHTEAQSQQYHVEPCTVVIPFFFLNDGIIDEYERLQTLASITKDKPH